MLACCFTGFIVNPLTYCKNTEDPNVSLLHRKGALKSGTYSLEPTDQNLSTGNGTQCSLPAADPGEVYPQSLLSKCWGGSYPFFPVQCPNPSHQGASSEELPAGTKGEASQQHPLCSAKHKLSTAENLAQSKSSDGEESFLSNHPTWSRLKYWLAIAELVLKMLVNYVFFNCMR